VKSYLTPLLLATLLGGCSNSESPQTSSAPGAPGAAPVWAYAGKTAIGTSYEQYLDGRFSDQAATGKVSKVWFSVAQGILTETMFGMIHQAQLKEMQFLIKGDDFLDTEKEDTLTSIEYLDVDELGRPQSLAFKIINKDVQGKYEIEKHIFTDPDQNSLFVKVIFRALDKNITPYLYVNPHMNNSGSHDQAFATKNMLSAQDDGVFMTLLSDQDFVKSSAGFVGVSDGLKDLQDNGQMDWHYASTGEKPGNVALTGQLATLNNQQVSYNFTLGFGYSKHDSEDAAQQTQTRGYQQVLAHYNGQGDAIGWQDYLGSLSALPGLSKTTTDGGKLLNASAMVLKAQEDKTYAGALIASLSNPWGDTVSANTASTGYKAVWPRDFYQSAMALMALGDKQTPLVSFKYLQQVQVKENTPGNKGANGWFLQKTHVDGQVEWVGVQLDQTAMPIMLGWKLWKAGVLSDQSLVEWYHKMLKPAADFLVSGGRVNLDWNNNDITPPMTQQERWEEQSGYSPSTTAAIISGLVAAADIAKLAGDQQSAARYLAQADKYSGLVEKTMFTTNGTHAQDKGDGSNGRYYIRLNPDNDPNSNSKLRDNNGKPGANKKDVLDAGFLELVRYGVRSAADNAIVDSLAELDSSALDENLRVKYQFSFKGETGSYPGWRRYGNDGYGEDVSDGGNYGRNKQMSAGQRGRVWPFFTGERGHYELAAAKSQLKPGAKLSEQQVAQLRNTYIKAMELFANEGLMLPEQVWDGVGDNSQHHYIKGEGTNSATPLAWTHAEYIKLVRSIRDQQVWDNYPIVDKRYGK